MISLVIQFVATEEDGSEATEKDDGLSRGYGDDMGHRDCGSNSCSGPTADQDCIKAGWGDFCARTVAMCYFNKWGK